MRRYAIFIVLRFVSALFFVLTAIYAAAVFSPFAFDMFIRPRVFAPVNQFVAWHHLLYLGAYALIAITLVPDLREPRTRRLAIGYLVVFGLVGEWLYVTPYLPKLWNGIECVVAAIAAFVPLVALAVIDHVAARPSQVLDEEHATPTAQRPLLFACLAASEYVWFLFMLRSLVRDFSITSAGGLVLVATWSLLLHLVAFIASYVVLNALVALAGLTRRRALWEYALIVPLIGAAILTILVRTVLPTISFSETWAIPLSAVAGLSLALTWSGWAMRRPASAARRTPLEIVAGPVAPSHRWVSVAILVAAPAVVFFLLGRIEKFDWNSLGQKFVVLLFWAIGFAVCTSLARHADDGRRTLARLTIPPVLVLAAALVVGAVSARLHRWTTDPWLQDAAALDRYAAIDPSFRLIYEALVDHPGADPQFARFLQTNTNVPYWAVPATTPDVSFVSKKEKPEGRPPNVFVFIIDSLRRDYMSSYNPAVTFTPNLQAFSDESLVFRNAFTRYGGTSLALPSLWAGGLLVHSAQHPAFRSLNAVEKLLETDGFQQFLGMDSVMAPILTRTAALTEINRNVPMMKFDMCNTMADFKDKLAARSRDAAPIFGYALIETLHISMIFNHKVPAGESYPGFYPPLASELRRIDSCFGDFIGYLKRTGLYDDSVVVVTADHGDALGENGAWGHGVKMMPEVVRVPLIFHLPERLKAKAVTDLGAVALLSDIAPTLYELAGHETRNVGTLFGRPLIALSEDRLDPLRRRRPYLLVASYAATYGMLRNNGRMLYVAEVVNGREYQFDLAVGLNGRRVDVTDGDRRLNRDLIRRQVTELDEFYHYTPQAWNMRPR